MLEDILRNRFVSACLVGFGNSERVKWQQRVKHTVFFDNRTMQTLC